MAGFNTASFLVSDIKAAVVRQFGDESGVQVTDTDIYRWINQGQLDINRRQRILKSTALANAVAGQSDYPVPNDVLFVQQMLVNGQPVEYRSFEEAVAYLLENDPLKTATGQPDIWYEWAGQYTFWPVPDISVAGTNNIKLLYIKAPTKVSALTDALSLPDSYFDTLLNYVLTQAHEMDEDWTAATYKGQQYENALATNSGDGNNTNQSTYQRITVLPEDM